MRFPDPTCNPYLAFSAMLMAGLDGIQRRLDPGQPLDKDIYALTPAELAEVPSMPASLEDALDNLKRDHEFLLKGDVFTEDLIETWIDYKMAKEVSDASAAASVRVRAVLRRLNASPRSARDARRSRRIDCKGRRTIGPPPLFRPRGRRTPSDPGVLRAYRR